VTSATLLSSKNPKRTHPRNILQHSQFQKLTKPKLWQLRCSEQARQRLAAASASCAAAARRVQTLLAPVRTLQAGGLASGTALGVPGLLPLSWRVTLRSLQVIFLTCTCKLITCASSISSVQVTFHAGSQALALYLPPGLPRGRGPQAPIPLYPTST
jgi:hypothetical protein